MINGNLFTMGYEDTQVLAKWKASQFEVTIDPDSGNWNGTSSKSKFNLNYLDTRDIPDPVRDGYLFTGWQVTGGGSEINSKTLTMGYENATLTATWEIQDFSYYVKHYKQNTDGNGYTLVDADTEEKTATFNTQVTPDTKSYVGFTSPTKKTLTITHIPANNLVEYNYLRNSSKLYIDPNGGKYNNSTNKTSMDVYYQQTKTIANPTRDGYNFSGWTGATLVDKVFTMGLSDVTLTANWTAQQYTVTFDANNGSVSPTKTTVTYDSKYGTLPTPTRNYYNFNGWYLNGVKVDKDTVVKTASNHTLVAGWTPIDYSVSYTLNGGSISGQKTSYNIESADFTLPTPTKDGYTFTGWTGTGLSNAQKTVKVSQGSTGNRVYTANWYDNATVSKKSNVGMGYSLNASLSDLPNASILTANDIFIEVLSSTIPNAATGTATFTKSYAQNNATFSVNRNHITGTGTITFVTNVIVSTKHRLISTVDFGMSTTINCKSISNYKSLTVNDFAIDYQSLTLPDDDYGTINYSKSYNASTGIFTISRNSISGNGTVTQKVKLYLLGQN